MLCDTADPQQVTNCEVPAFWGVKYETKGEKKRAEGDNITTDLTIKETDGAVCEKVMTALGAVAGMFALLKFSNALKCAVTNQFDRCCERACWQCIHAAFFCLCIKGDYSDHKRWYHTNPRVFPSWEGLHFVHSAYLISVHILLAFFGI